MTTLAPFLMVLVQTEYLDSEDRGEGEPLLEKTLPHSIIPCQDTREIAAAMMVFKSLDDGTFDWSLFQAVDGKYVRRAITFKRDGQVVWDVVLA